MRDSNDSFDADDDDLESAVLVLVRQGEEPPAFCALFHGWYRGPRLLIPGPCAKYHAAPRKNTSRMVGSWTLRQHAMKKMRMVAIAITSAITK
jgi:hypothetical protein